MSSPISRRPVLQLGFFRQLAVLFAAVVFSGAAYATINAALQMQTGNPSGATADPANHSHFLIQRPQYALDYNDTTHEPNWVSWDLTADDVGGSGRSNFIVDTTLPSGFYQVLTTDYSGSGYDRGHMCPSADRTVTAADNQQLFYMSNMIPQSPDNNQGVWASFENYCRSLASAGNEILITSGPSGFGGSTIASGVAIPGFTWKIAVVVPLGGGTAVSRLTSTTRVIAIKIPNVAGVRNTPWENFTTTVLQIEADTGFHFFTDPSIPSGTATALRSEPQDGQSATGAPGILAQPIAQSAPVGGTATFNVTASGDAPLTYQWLKDDNEIAGATSVSLTLTNVQAADVANYSVTVTNGVGSVTSNGAALVISGLPPTITTQPVSRTLAAGSAVSFTVVPGGSAPFTYQWSKGGVPLSDGGNVSGSATPTLTLSNVQNADAANFSVVVTNNVSAITSDVVSLAVTAAAPTITSQPANRSLAPGSTASFTVVAVGTSPLSYQWRKGGTAISTVTNPSAGTATLTLTSISLADAGSYDVVVSNGIGSPATSSAASLSISSASTTQIFYTGGTYVQDFNTLPASGTFTNNIAGSATAVVQLAQTGTGIGAAGMGGWSIAQTLASGGTERFTVGTGSANTGSAYSFGATAVAERALGILNSSSAVTVFGTTIVNNTGQTISALTLGYTGEQWRWGGSTGDKLSVEYQVGGTDIITGTFTSVPALDFVSPIQSGTAGALDGNNANNRRTLSAAVSGLTWAPGQTIVIRWKGFRTSSADGLSADDFSFSTPVTGPSGPSVASTSPATGATGAALNTPIAITFDQAVTASGSSFTINSATRGALSAAVSASADSKTYTLTLPANFDFSEAISVNVLASGVTSQSTGLHPAANYSFSFTTTAAIAPSIATQPSPQTVAAGSTASFTVGANGTAPFTFQWRKNGAAITGNPTAVLATLVVTDAQAADIANYDVVVSNGIGSPVTSNPASLSVTPAAPTITTQPIAQTVAQGASVSFTAGAKGTEPFTYQWRKGGVAIAGNPTATTPTLVLTNVQAADIAGYDVVVSDGINPAATSTAVNLTVIVPPSVINYAGGTYAQNFDTLPNTGTFTFAGVGPFSLDAPSPVGVGATGATGWSIAKSTGTGANVLFRFDDGTSTAGNIASYGTTGATDRALGSLASGTFAGRLGVTLVNTTGHTIDFVTINYTGEQWRYAGSTVVNKLAFAYAVGAADLSTGTFTTATALDFTAPIATGGTTKLDGNLAANRVPNITSTLTGLNWAPGQTLVLRWTDTDDTGSDSALAIDDFSLTDAPPVPVITTQPVAQTVPAFTPASFTVAATSTTAQTYQWQKNGVDIAGNASAITPTLTLASATAADVATYDCVVTNQFGSTTSNAVALSIIKVAATVALDPTVPVYDGTQKFASATTSPAGLNVAFVYNSSPTAPTNAGTYAVTATIVDANYFGSIDGSFTIAPAVAIVALGNLNTIYNGTSQPATATTVPASLPVAFTYDLSATAPTNAGGYAVAATVTDPNYTGSATGTLTIAKAGAGVALSDLGQVYNTVGHVATVTTIPAGLAVAVTYDTTTTAPINAGNYAIVATVNDANYFGSASGTLAIAKANAPVVLGGLSAVYDTSLHAATATTTPAGLTVTLSYNGSATAPTNAGSYPVAASVVDANYAGSASGTLVIDKANAPVALAGLTATYDGTPRVVTATTTPAGLNVALTYDLAAAAPVNAGSYAIAATINEANYTGSAAGTLVVAKASATIAFGNVAQIYDGTARSVTVTTVPAGLTTTLTYDSSATAPTNAGTYALAAAITDANYTGAATGTLTIAKAAATVALSNLSQTYSGAPKSATIVTTPANLAVLATYAGNATPPTNAGSYPVAVTITDPNYSGSASGTLAIAKAAATVVLTGLNATYDGSAKTASATTTPVGLTTTFTYDGGTTAPINSGSYNVVGSVSDNNYTGSANGILVISKATATVTLGGLHQTYDGTAKSVSATTAPAGLNTTVTYNGSTTAPTAAGSYAVVATVNNANYAGTAGGTFVIATANATIALSNLTQVYDGTPKSATATTTPANLTVAFTYNGGGTAPTNPGSYAVVATITDPNYSATASNTLVITSTALVRHAPSLDGGLDGSLQVLTGENLTLNGNAWVSGDILVPGTPTVRLNGHPTFAGTQDGTGSTTPSNYQVTLNGNAVLRHLVRRTDPIAMPVVAAPAAPTGTRNVSLNSASDSAGDFATIRNLTLNGNAGTRTVPAGTYGAVTVNGNSGLVLGVAGSTTPAVYQLQGLTLNGNAQIQIAGPVVIVLANGVSLSGDVGAAAHPEWLSLNVASGGVTLNGNVTFNGSVVAPNGTVVINGNTTLNGSVVADRLTLNGNSVLNQP